MPRNNDTMSEGLSVTSAEGKVDLPSSEVKSMSFEKGIPDQDLHRMSEHDISTECLESQSRALDVPVAAEDGTKVESSGSPDGGQPFLQPAMEEEAEASVSVSKEETPQSIARSFDDGVENVAGKEQDTAVLQTASSTAAREPETSLNGSSIREQIRAPEQKSQSAPQNASAIENPGLLSSRLPVKKATMKIPTRQVKDDDLKSKVVIPKYLSEGMKLSIQSAGVFLDSIPRTSAPAPAAPILVFINSKSGGRLGPKLQKTLVKLIAPEQVYDLSQYKPSDILRHGLGYLEKEATAGDLTALETRNNLRIMVAGGDGTVGWVLGSISELQLREGFKVPPVGVIPLGTGNDLSRSFHWGASTAYVTHSRVRRCLTRATEAGSASLDSWQIVVKPTPTRQDAKLSLPHAMHPQHHIPLEHSTGRGTGDVVSPYFEGSFWNYFSLGMDAQVAYGFHHLRNAAPWLASGRVSNQVVYGGYGCAQGWFCTPCAAVPVARGLRQIAKLSIRRVEDNGQFANLEIPSNIRALVILNLQSYAGGRNPWGRPSAKRQLKEGFVPASCSDRVLEVIGLRDGWHTALVLLDLFKAVRLCQAKEVRLELRGNARRKVAYMQMDGEPWQQPLGLEDDSPAVVEISCRPVPSICLSRKKV